MPGFSAPEIHKKISLRASVTSELVLQDVRVPDENLLPGVDDAARAALVPQRGAVRDRLGLGGRRPRLLRGGARLREGADRLRQADLGLPADAAEARRDGARAEPGRPRRAPPRPDEGRRNAPPEHVSLGKMGNVRGALEVCRRARTILGANGVTLEYPVIRHMNNLESVLTYEGTHEVHTLVVGEALTGENAFRSSEGRGPPRRGGTTRLLLPVPVVEHRPWPAEQQPLRPSRSARRSCRCPGTRRSRAGSSTRA